MSNQHWDELLKSVSVADEYLVRNCGYWTEDKLFAWHDYLRITTNAMCNNPKWQSGLVYVDLFAGPGICRVEAKNKRLPGSPIIACSTSKPFDKIILVENDKACFDACKARLDNRSINPKIELHIIHGDCNARIDDVVNLIPHKALTLAFVDPPGFDVEFDTLAKLAHRRRVDFLILFSDAIDLVRNVQHYYDQEDSKADRMFGPNSDWRTKWDNLNDQSGYSAREMFANLFKSQVKSLLGYKGFREVVIKGPNGPLYKLIFASKHERGLEFWDKVSLIDRSGQRGLFGG